MVTTFIPHRSLEDDEGRAGHEASSHTLALVAAVTPSQSRRRALIRLVRNQEGREVLLQLLQAISLLLQSFAPTHAGQRRLLLVSESISSARKALLVGRWLAEGSNAIQDQLNESTKGIIVRDVNGLALDKVDGGEKREKTSEDEEEDEVSAEESQRQAVGVWKAWWQDSVGSLSDYLAIGAETCDLLAFCAGSGLLWRAVGGKLASRQRRGLERVAVFLGFLSMLFALVHLRHLRDRQRRLLRVAHARLLRATDQVMDNDAEVLLQGHTMLAEQALSNDAAPRSTVGTMARASAKGAGGEARRLEQLLRRKERQVFLEKKKLNNFRLERNAIRTELFSTLVELLWPHHDHSRLEGFTGIVASLCHISRLAVQSRWQL